MDYSNYKILIIDDEIDTTDFITYNLTTNNFQVFTANNGKEGIKTANEKNPHVILLDIMMPGMDGIEVCEELRKNPALKDTMIVFLTARGEDYSQIAGFEAGGDDYIKKPIRPKVLISRIKALLKRFSKSEQDVTNSDASPNEGSIIQKKTISIDKDRYVVMKDGKEMGLPRKEFELLLLLSSNPNKVYTREQIFQSIWGEGIIVSDRTIDVHIRKLREKLGSNTIKTIKGVGYKFID